MSDLVLSLLRYYIVYLIRELLIFSLFFLEFRVLPNVLHYTQTHTHIYTLQVFELQWDFFLSRNFKSVFIIP